MRPATRLKLSQCSSPKRWLRSLPPLPRATARSCFRCARASAFSRGRNARGRKRRLLAAALGHVLDFRTWRSLTEGGQISRTEAIQLAGALVDGATRP